MSAKTQDQVSGRVKQLAAAIYPYHLKYEKQRDPRAIFAYVYYNITLDLAQALEDPASGLEDPDWAGDLALAFGRRYLAAMDALDTWLGAHSHPDKSMYDSVPRPWADVYLAIWGDQSYVLEDLAFAMMAHISYDLPHALVELNPDISRLTDYHRMNEFLASKTDFIQDKVAERYQRTLSGLDRLTGTFDEFLTNYGIRGARAVAWYNAMRLQVGSSRELAERSIQTSTGSFIQAVRQPDEPWMRLAVRFLRWVIPHRRRWPQPTPGESIGALEAAGQRVSRW